MIVGPGYCLGILKGETNGIHGKSNLLSRYDSSGVG